MIENNQTRSPKLILLGMMVPIFIILIFMVASVLPNYLIAPPKYSFIYTKDVYSQSGDNIHVRFKVINGKLFSECKKDDKKEYYNREAKLFIFEADKLVNREIFYQLPNRETLTEQWMPFVIDELKELQVDTSRKAADGYEFEENNNDYSYSGLLLGYHRRNKNIISHSGRHVAFSENYEPIQFLGWIIKK